MNNSKEFDPLLHETEQKQNSIHTNQRSGSLVKKAHNSHTINPSLKVIKNTSKLKVLIPEKDVDETAWSEVDYACLTTGVPSSEPKLKLIAGCNDQWRLNSDSRPQQTKLATRINVDLINCPKQQQISPTTIDSASCTITDLNSVPSALGRKLNLPLIEFPNLNNNTKPKDHLNTLQTPFWQGTLFHPTHGPRNRGGHWGTVPPHFCKNQENVPFFHWKCALLETLTLQLFDVKYINYTCSNYTKLKNAPWAASFKTWGGG